MIYYQVVYFNFLASDGTVPTFTSLGKDSCCSAEYQSIEFKLTAIPDDSGNFSITARIPPIIFSEMIML